jgi:hypothetical protein
MQGGACVGVSGMQDGLAWAACRNLQAAAASGTVAQVAGVPAGMECADGDRIRQDGAGARVPVCKAASCTCHVPPV